MSSTDLDDETRSGGVAAPPKPARPEVPRRPTPNEAPLVDPDVAGAVDLIEIGEVVTRPPEPVAEPETDAPERRPYRGLRTKTANRILALVAFAIPFLQSPGKVFTDSRSDLTADPILFLSRVVDVWSTTYDFGHVQSGQFVGYLFPMAPFFAGGTALGIPMWIVQRLWLGILLAGAAVGISKVVSALWRRGDGFACLLAGLVYLLNPYIVTQVNRGTVTLLAYAVLPWLMLAAHRSLLEPRRWRWPVIGGLLVAAGGGGVNAAVLLWVLAAPLALIAYEVAVIGRSRRAAWSVLWRTGVCVIGLSLWWMIPVSLQGTYGADFLSFTEQPSTIWATNSVSESLRLLGYWITYFQIGFGASRPVVPPTVDYLFMPLLVFGSFIVPILAFAFLPLVWRRAYIPFFVMLAIGSIIAMSVGFPPGKPLNRLLVDAYYQFPALQVLRTTYKAAPLLAFALAVMIGAGGAQAIRKIRLPSNRRAAIVGLLAAPLIFGWPLVTGNALDPALTYKDVPSYWREAVADVDASAAPGHRTMILPGQQFGVYRWGTTFDPIAPAITRTPVAQRYSVRYSDAHSSQLLSAIDNLVQQRRAVPGQLRQMLVLLGVQQVLVASDGLPENSGEIDPASAQEVFRQTADTKRPNETYGPTIDVPPAVGRGGEAVRLPAIRRFEIPAAAGKESGVVRAHSRNGSTVVSGDANALVEMAAHGMLANREALLFSGDATRPDIRKMIRRGASLVITDTNRRQTVLATRTTHDQGAVLSVKDRIAPDVPSYSLFAGIGNAKQTVAVYTGADYVTNPEGPQLLLRPEARPYAAVDGDLRTTWTPSNFLADRRWIEIALKRRKVLRTIRIHPHRDKLVQTTLVGLSVDGAPERRVVLLPGWNDVSVGDAAVRKIRIRILHTSTFGGIDLGGIDEIQLPGMKIREWLRTPIWTAQALAGKSLPNTPITVLLSRQSTSDPYRQSGAYGGPVPTGDPKATFDAELGLQRIVSIPEQRSFSLRGWASSAPWSPDTRFDRLTGLRAGWAFSGSPRFEGVPSHRASSAFDGNPRTSWVSEDRPGVRPWIEWRSPRPVRLTRFRLVPGSRLLRRPVEVKVRFGGLVTGSIAVQRDGTVLLPQPFTTNSARIEFTKTEAPAGAAAYRLLPAMGLREIVVPGVKAEGLRTRGRFNTRCGELSVSANDTTVRAKVSGTIADLDSGRPLRFSVCGATRSLVLSGGPNAITAEPGNVMRIDHLKLESKVPSPPRRTVAKVISGSPDKDGFTEVRFGGPGWLVHAESFSIGWKASCGPTRDDQRDLGMPFVADGFAAGWQVGSWCRYARFWFAPQSRANSAYVASAGATGIFALMLGGSLLATRRRRLAGGPAPIEPLAPSAPGDDRVTFARRQFAATVPLLAGGVAAAVFALRVGPPVALIALFLGLWGVNVRRLYRLAAAALVLLPFTYIALTPQNKGGGNFYYAVEQIMPHWLATIAILLAASGAVLTALRIRWATHPRAGRWSLRRVQATIRMLRIRRADGRGSRSSRRGTRGPRESG